MNGFNFTDRVRKVLAMARQEANRFSHEYVGTEHILLALVADDGGVAVAVLAEHGVEGDGIRRRVEEVVKPGRADGHQVDLPYTSRAKKVLELAMSEARTMLHSYVGTEHLLLGLLAEQKGMGAQVLNELGVTLDSARRETRRLVQGPESPAANRYTAVPHVASPGYARTRTTYALALVEDFSGRAREVLRTAYDQAAGRGETAVDLVHILLALAMRDDGMASVILDQLTGGRQYFADALSEGLPEERVVAERVELRLTPAAQRALDASLLEASKDGHRRSGTQHVLLAILDALPREMAELCASHGVAAQAAREEYDRMRE